MKKLVAVLIAGLALGTAGVAGAVTTPSSWMTLKEANALLHEAPVYLPGHGQFYFPPNNGRCKASGPFKRDTRKKVWLFRYFECGGPAEATFWPGRRWSVYFRAAPGPRGFRILRVHQANCYYPVETC